MAGQRTFRMDLHGAKALEAALRQLPKRIGKGAIRRALKKAVQPIADDAQSRAPVGRDREGGEHLRDKIAVGTKLSKRQRRSRARGSDPNRVDVYVGAQPARHAHLVEFGSGPRRTKSGKSTGVMPAQPFMRPAWDSGKRRALRQFEKLLWREIEKSARNLARRQAKAARAGR